ncbi:hypothetical protein WJX74_010974 [Apatococcus lobatus]|uniref:Uncharacterized protein n=1 Tax=Apatococcus lobatus TaxID=904363 RepID=A0AAW1S8E9_9CHLO
MSPNLEAQTDMQRWSSRGPVYLRVTAANAVTPATPRYKTSNIALDRIRSAANGNSNQRPDLDCVPSRLQALRLLDSRNLSSCGPSGRPSRAPDCQLICRAGFSTLTGQPYRNWSAPVSANT